MLTIGLKVPLLICCIYRSKKKHISPCAFNNIRAAIILCHSTFAWEHMGLCLMSQCDYKTSFIVLTEA